MPERPPRPGLAKVRTPPVLQRRRAELVAALGGRILELVSAASIMSEGQARTEESGQVYYGTTTLLFTFASAGGILPDEAAADPALAFENDPHARLQMLRIAHREASARAAQLGVIQAEIRVEIKKRGVMVSIDVAAPIQRRRAKSTAF
jgi:hypothetical protein